MASSSSSSPSSRWPSWSSSEIFRTPNSVGLQVLGVGPVFRRPLRIRSLIFFSFGVRCSGVPKTPKNQILDFLYSLSWCSDVAFLIVGYRSGAPLVFQRPLNFPFQIFFSGSVRCSGVPKTPKFQISDFRLFLFGVRPTDLGLDIPELQHAPKWLEQSSPKLKNF